ncbi:MAG: dihydrolipoyl dehydrogenase [Defluviitaleaceae bacterium]|nr:dihydrolipoyl dehydrogenase [Defluviitaleaceae bacterium]
MYDIVVIGGGPGGYVAAIRGAQYGLKTALVESNELGGTCLNRGCIPTKTILHMSHIYKEMQNSHDMGITAENLSYDINKMHSSKDEVVTKLRNGIESLLKANNVDVYKGIGKINTPGKVEVNRQDIETKNIIIATGSLPWKPPFSGTEFTITSNSLLEGSQKDIKTLVIVGGGVIGVEMASIYNNLGADVTIIEAAERILPSMPKEISQSLAMELKKQGIKIHTSASLKEVTETDPGAANTTVTATFEEKSQTKSIQGDRVLMSTGRIAHTFGFFSGNLNIDHDRGFIVDENFKTSVDGIYAIGDCIAGSVQLAHMASAQAMNCVAVIAGKEPPMDLSLVPACIYTSPEIAMVGITEEDAKIQGINIKTTKYLTSGHGKSLAEGQGRGFVKLIFKEENQVLLGAQLMCSRATDIISQITVCINQKLTAQQIASVIQPHPSFAEGVQEAAENLLGHAIHIAPPKKR